MAEPRKYWLLKTEPATFGLQDLQRAPRQTTPWDGVRNYQARNFMRDEMRVDDGVLIYHSQAQPLAIVAQARVASAAYADPSQFDPTSPYVDPAATTAAPRWWCVDVQLVAPFARPVLRTQLQAEPALADMVLLRRGSRLSVQPVAAQAWRLILALAQR